MSRLNIEASAKFNEAKISELCDTIGIGCEINSLISEMTSMANAAIGPTDTIQDILDRYHTYLVGLVLPEIGDAINLAPLGSAIVQTGRARECLDSGDDEGAMFFISRATSFAGDAQSEIMIFSERRKSLLLLAMQKIESEKMIRRERHSRDMQLSGLNAINDRKRAAKDVAIRYANELWTGDERQELKPGRVTNLVRGHLIQQGFSGALPEGNESLKAWIKDTIPGYAKKPGRPSKKK